MTAAVGATAPGMLLFLVGVLVVTVILTAVVEVLIERRYEFSAGASARAPREKAGTGRVSPRLPVSATYRNERGETWTP